MTHLNEIVDAAYKNSAAHGFWDDAPEYKTLRPQYLAIKIALIHSEASEALEELRKDLPYLYTEYPPVPASLAVEFPSGADATEVWQKSQPGKPGGLASELADIIIRVADLAGYLGIDLDNAVVDKMAYNATRKPMHGKAF